MMLYVCMFIFRVCVNGMYQGEYPTAVRRNRLDLTLEPIYNCNLGYFAA
ncbi:unnamed protein product [Brassica oleracea]